MTSKPSEKMLWGGRFTGGLDPLMISFNENIHNDRVIYAQDIRGSIAFARANNKAGILTSHEFSEMERGLKQVLEEWQTNKFDIKPGIDEDIHTANERRLGEIIGKDIAGKLHTGRSRNDQSSTGMRLWVVDQLRKTESYISDLLSLIVSRASAEINVLMPGYTHLQRAQPVRWSHWLLAHGTSFAQDLERLRQVVKHVNRSPLGSGAIAGNPFGIDRKAIADELGFESVLWNSMAAVGDRDFVVETLQWQSMLMLHVSRWAEDMILYSTAEFGFLQLADAYSTGSSHMPQKKNPDSLELLRGKCGRVFGRMAGMMMAIKGLPSTYNKDLQESFEAVVDATTTVQNSIQIMTGVLSTVTIFPDKMKAALTPDMLATDLADYLVRKGAPFRETHHISGSCVALAEKEKKPMDKLSYEQLKGIDSRFEEDVMDCFDYEARFERRNVQGGPARSSVEEQIEHMKTLLV